MKCDVVQTKKLLTLLEFKGLREVSSTR